MGQILDYERNRKPSGLAVIFFIVVIDRLGFGLIIPLLPFYATRFGASPLKVTLLFSIFSICQFVAGLAYARHVTLPWMVSSALLLAAGMWMVVLRAPAHRVADATAEEA